MTHTLRKYCDRSTRFRFQGPFTDTHRMAMARNEYEGFQVLVYPMAGELKGVTLKASDLAGPDGAKIPAADVTWNPQEMVFMHRNGKTRDWYYHGKRYWIPDPLTNPRPTDLPPHVSTPFWVTVRTRPQTKAGTYKGTITVRPDNAPPRELKLTVKVWNYKVPERWNFQTMGQSCWGNYWRAMQPALEEAAARGGKEAARKKRSELHRKYIDFLMDHRFMPTQQYSGALSPSLADIPYCVGERGGNTIYLSGNFRFPAYPDEGAPEIRKLKQAFWKAKEKLLTDAGKGEDLKKLQARRQVERAAVGKKRLGRRARAKALDEVNDRFEADKDTLLATSAKAGEFKKLSQAHQAEKAAALAGMMARYQAGKARGLKELRRRCDAVIALDAKLRAEGKYAHPETLMDMSLVYIGDETSDWARMRRNSDAIRRACPELMIMIGGSFPRKELDGIIDIYDPQIGGGSKTYSLSEEMTGKIAESQARGERFFWYDAAGPMLPFPNVQCEEPLIAARAVFWMTWKYGVTGFEYYCYAIWSHNFPRKDKKTGKWHRWPQKPFTPWGWGQTNGDGMLYYPGPDGPFSSVRFENIRDGIEDWESHFVLRDCLEALKKKGAASDRAKALIAKAAKLLKVPDQVVKDLKTWTWEPEVLLKARRDLGETLDAVSRLVTEEEIVAVRLARKKAELAQQYKMLKERAAAAAKAPKP